MNIGNNCLRKRSYTEAAARAAVAQLRRRGAFRGIGAFRCGLCRQWHLGRTR